MNLQIFWLFLFLFSKLICFNPEIKEKILYTVPTSDRISGIHELSNGRIICGIGLSDRSEQGSEATFVVSDDKGKTWKEIWVPEATDMKTYMIQSHDNIVIAVRGDRGHPQVLRSTDYGDTWNVSLSTEDLLNKYGTGTGLYSVIYHKFNKKFYIFPETKVLESSDDGLTWESSTLILNTLSRNAYYIDETDEMFMPSFSHDLGLFVLRKNDTEIRKVINDVRVSAFAYLGNGVMLASAFTFVTGYDYKVLKLERKNNELYITLNKVDVVTKNQMITLSVNPQSKFSQYSNTNTFVTRVNGSVITIKQIGDDIKEEDAPENATVYTGTGNNLIYVSNDYGYNWELRNNFTGCNHAGYILFSRCFPTFKNGIALISIAGDEEEINKEGVGVILRTDDYGMTWKNTDEVKGPNNHRLNAIYVCTYLKDGTQMCGAQYGRIIMTLNTEKNSNSNGGLATSTIIIIILTVIGILLLGLIIFLICRKNKNKLSNSKDEDLLPE